MKAVGLVEIKKMHKAYVGGLTLKEVAHKFNYKSGTTVLYHFQNHKLITRPRGGNQKESQAGSNNGNWKGGRVKGKNRYIRIWQPNHPKADSLGYIREHHLVAEKALGRSLKRDEIVHHINGDITDNRNENLLVSTQSYHASLHVRQRRLRNGY